MLLASSERIEEWNLLIFYDKLKKCYNSDLQQFQSTKYNESALLETGNW